MAGLVAGALLAIEIPTGGIFFLVGLLALASDRRPERRVTLLRYGLGFGIVTLSMALVNLFAYGYPLDAYLVPGSFAFDESIHAAGAAGLRRPDNLPAYLFHLTLGQRGVFSHMPFLLLALGYLVTRRGTLPRLDRLAAAGILVLWVFYGTQTGIYGGWAYGFRFLVPVIPLLFWWSTLWVLESPRAWRTGVAVVLLVVGLVTSWVGTGNPWPVAYEGVATRPGAIEDEVRSPLLSNLLVWSFERNPRGALFERLSTHYGRPVTLGYLEAELWNRRRPDARERLLRLAERWRDVE